MNKAEIVPTNKFSMTLEQRKRKGHIIYDKYLQE